MRTVGLISSILLLFTAMIMSGCSGPPETETGTNDLDCCSGITRESLREANPDIQLSDIDLARQLEAPEGMVYIPGGATHIGSLTGLDHERPIFRAEVQPLYMDRHPVTVGQYRAYIEATGYSSFSEQIGDGIVFSHDQARWIIEPGVNWEYPQGKNYPPAPDDHPVTLLTWNEAVEYLNWVGKRLPTEIEWEHAARGITNRNDPYAWGKELRVDGQFMANTWNGQFPQYNAAEDGYLLTSPVGLFGETELGLTDMGGNVWEWTSDWYRSYADRDKPFEPTPDSEKALRGGSFMCHISYCHGYRVSGRSNTPPDNNMFHVGFRGVREIE
jgi:formylglycine-generating enzyme